MYYKYIDESLSCSNCFYWKGDGKLGICSKLPDYEHISIHSENDYGTAVHKETETRSDFFCALHELQFKRI